MSKGLGKLQKRILEVANFTASIDEVSKPGDFEIVIEDADDCAVTEFAGQPIELHQGSSGTWKNDGKAVLRCRITAPASAIVEAKKLFRWVKLEARAGFDERDKGRRYAPEIAAAAVPLSALLATMYPEQFAADYRTTQWTGKGKKAYQYCVPDDMRKAKASCRVLVSRALSSLCKRGILAETWCVRWTVGTMKQRGWTLPYKLRHNCDESCDLATTLFLVRQP